jgi:hypothetical protein
VAAGTTTITAASGAIMGTALLSVTGGASAPGSVTLAWDAPTTNTDGTSLTDLAGFKVYYGISSGNYTAVVNVGNVATYTVNSLAPGYTYYFNVTAYNTSNLESNFANEVSKTIP